MSFFGSIIESLYNVEFYRRVIREPLSRGLIYLVGWSLFACLLFTLYLSVRVYPEVRGFMNWVEETIPPIQWTPEGLRMSQKSPYEMKHKKYGHFATINLDKKEIEVSEVGDALIYVTATKVYVKERQDGGLRVYDVLPKEKSQLKQNNIIFDGSLIQKLENKMMPFLVGLALFLIFAVFFIWKIVAALFYSTVGMLINQFREDPLPYEAVLNISFYAMTGSILVQLIAIILTEVVQIPFGFWGSLFITLGYLYLGIKLTQDPPDPPIEADTLSV